MYMRNALDFFMCLVSSQIRTMQNKLFALLQKGFKRWRGEGKIVLGTSFTAVKLLYRIFQFILRVKERDIDALSVTLNVGLFHDLIIQGHYNTLVELTTFDPTDATLVKHSYSLILFLSYAE